MGFYEDLMKGLNELIGEEAPYRNQAELARACNVDPMRVHRLLKEKRPTNLQKLAEILDGVGAKITFPQDRSENSRDVHFVKPQIVSGDEAIQGPTDDQYIAVPLANRPVAAGSGIIPEDRVDSWILVWKGQEAVRHKTNLSVVRIDSREGSSMEPTLHPGDLALIDRDDFRPKNPPGNIYLVQTPEGDEMSLAIKRVRIQVKNEKEHIIFYSDNPEHGPELYDLQADYEGELTRAVKGRVIWSWSDMTKK